MRLFNSVNHYKRYLSINWKSNSTRRTKISFESNQILTRFRINGKTSVPTHYRFDFWSWKIFNLVNERIRNEQTFSCLKKRKSSSFIDRRTIKENFQFRHWSFNEQIDRLLNLFVSSHNARNNKKQNKFD